MPVAVETLPRPALAGPAERATCTHCGLPAGPRPLEETVQGIAGVFCCTGCLWVARLVGGGGEGTVARALALRLGLAVFFALNTMVFSLAHYGNLLGGDESLGALRLMDVQRWAQMLFTIPVMAILAVPSLYRLGDLVRGRPAGLDGLVAVAASAAFALSVANTLRGAGEVYFDTVNMLLILVTLGKALEATARSRAVRDGESLREEMVEDYPVVRGEASLTLDPSALQAGDRVRVEPGRQIPVDGRVAEGSALVRREWLTGESRPDPVDEGDEVLAGFCPVDAPLTVEAAGSSRQSRRARLEQLLDDARTERPHLVHVGDRLGTILFWVTLVVAALAFWVGWRAAGLPEALTRTLATLAVACPCAMGIAAPLAFWNGWRAPARSGIWLSGPEAIERLAEVEHVAFDKTGTLTGVEPRVRSVRIVEGWDREAVLSWVAAVEREVPHPLARALTELGTGPHEVTGLHLVPGSGVEATVDGRHLAIGSGRWFARRGVAGLSPSPEPGDAHRVHIAVDGVLAAVLELDEEVRFGAGPAVRGLASLDVAASLWSGDDPRRVARVARLLHIPDAAGHLSPEDKLDRLRERAARSRVAMVGDGLNDAAAVAAAWVGVALGRSADLTRSAAHVAAVGAGPAVVPALIRHARRTRRVVWQNLAWSVGYNSVALTLAAMGRLHPVAAAAVMLVSSLTVVLGSRRAARFEAPPTPGSA